MKPRRILVPLLIIVIIWLVVKPMLPTKQIVVPSVAFKIIDEQTGLPLEGIKVHADCGYTKPKWVWGLIVSEFVGYDRVGEIWSSEDFTSDKNGMVTIPKRTKFGSDYGQVLEGYWINSSGFLGIDNGLPDIYANKTLKNLNILYDSIFFYRSGLSSTNKSPIWQIKDSTLVKQTPPPDGTTFSFQPFGITVFTIPEPAPQLFILKLRPHDAHSGQ